MGRPKTASATAEERKKRKRELERKRYQKIKGNPVLNAQYRQKNKAKYAKRKEQKKVISIKDMTPRAQRVQRKKWREAFNAYYKRKKDAKAAAVRFMEAQSPPDSGDEENNVLQRNTPSPSILTSFSPSSILMGNKENANPNSRLTRSQESPLSGCRSDSQVSNISSVSNRGNSPSQLIRRLRYKKDKEIQALTNQLEGVKKVNEAYRKKIRRLTEEKKESSVDVINDKLLQSYTALRTHKAKQEFSSHLQVNIKRTLKNKGRLGKLTNIFRRRISEQKGSKVKKIREDIKAFLEEDENSSVTAGKKENIKKAGVVKQRRYMTDSLYHLHRKFLTKVDYKLSFATFSRFRPFWILFSSQKPKETCLCITHENFGLLVQAMHRNHMIPHKNATDVLIDICCDHLSSHCLLRICKDCKTKSVTNFQEFDDSVDFSYWSWVSKREQILQNGREKTIRVVKKERIVTRPRAAIQTFEKQLDVFAKHCGRVTAQHDAIKKLKYNLQPEEAIIHVDFSENYKCQYAKEIQAVHFGGSRKQVTLHTSVLYFFDSNSTRTTQSFATLSQNLRHDAAAVWAHVVPILEYLNEKAPQIKTLHFVSDSATSQYRNYKAFFVIGALKWQYPSLTTLTWNYTESGHGKGAPDGVGGTLKRTADAIVSRGHDIPDFDTFVEELNSNVKNIVIKIVSDYDIIEKDILLPTELRSFKGTQKIHQVVWNDYKKYQVTMRNLSCVEKACIVQPECCDHVKYLGSHVLRPDMLSHSSNPNPADQIENPYVAPLERSYAFCVTREADLPEELMPEIATEASEVRSDRAELCFSEETIIENLDSINLFESDYGVETLEDVENLHVPIQTVTKSALDKSFTQHLTVSASAVTAVSPVTSRLIPSHLRAGPSKGNNKREKENQNIHKKNKKSKGITASKYKKRVKLSAIQKYIEEIRKKKPRTKNQRKNHDETSSDEEIALPLSPESDLYSTEEEVPIENKKSEENDNSIDEDNVHEGDWVVVKFVSEKNVTHRYVGQVVNESLASLDIKFAKKIYDRRFKWPEKPDISVVGKYQVIKKLPPPKFKSSSKRIGAFEFDKSLRHLKIDK